MNKVTEQSQIRSLEIVCRLEKPFSKENKCEHVRVTVIRAPCTDWEVIAGLIAAPFPSALPGTEQERKAFCLETCDKVVIVTSCCVSSSACHLALVCVYSTLRGSRNRN